MITKLSSGIATSCRPVLIASGLLAVAFGTTTSQASIFSGYTNDFESLNPASGTALGDDFWEIYGNVFSADGLTYLYGYGNFPAPNNGPGFCSVTTGQGGAAQGSQGLVAYSDYNNNGAQTAGDRVEANVFQADFIVAEDVGPHVFRFDAKKGDLIAPSTARAFIRVLNPATGYSTTQYLFLDTTALPVAWGTYSISINITSPMVGQILQFGFTATASNYNASGVYYDNVNFGIEVPAPPAPPVITQTSKTGNVVSVTFPTVIGASYDLFKSTDGMQTFNPVGTQPTITGDGTSKVANDNAATQSAAFYRIRRVQ